MKPVYVDLSPYCTLLQAGTGVLSLLWVQQALLLQHTLLH